MITVLELKNRLIPKLHGATLNKVADSFYSKLHESSSVLLGRIDPPDTIQTQRIDNAIYDKIYNYTAPTGIKNGRLLDIRPIGPRAITDDQRITYSKEFDTKKEANSATIEVVNGVRTLRVSKVLAASTVLYDPEAVDSYITASGDVTDLAVDNLDFVSGFGSLSFGLSGSTGIGALEIALPTSFDLSTLLNIGSLFDWLKFPDSSRFTSYELRWGSDSSNYWSKTATVPQGRSSVDSNAWNLMPYAWSSASKTGSPDESAIAYLKVTINYTAGAALTFVKLDSIVASLGAAYESVFYSENIYRDASSGALKNIPTADTDIITLDDLATEILVFEMLRTLAVELKGDNMDASMKDATYKLDGEGYYSNGNWIGKYKGLYNIYAEQNPSQALSPETTYYEYDDIGSNDFFNDAWE